MSGRACAELVVQDDSMAVRPVQVGEREHVRVKYAWAVVKNYERPRGGLKIVYDVWNVSEPTRNVTELEVMVFGGL